jgi:hypothetical protein
MTLKRSGLRPSGKPLVRTTPLLRTAPIQTQRRRSRPPTRPGLGKAKTQPIVKRRCGGWCELRLPGTCLGLAGDSHHRRKKSKQGPWSPSNILRLCRLCHDVITDTRAEYYERGWLVESWDDWATQEVRMWAVSSPLAEREPEEFRLGWYLLDDKGGSVFVRKWTA